MNLLLDEETMVLGADANGTYMTPEEFDAVQDADENYLFELVNGVVIVNGIPLAQETSPNELLGRLLLNYQEFHPLGSALDHTLPQQYVRTRVSRRIADRLIWTGLGRVPNVRRDVPSIAAEFVSAGRRNWHRDYVDKRREYAEAGIAEYWIFDRFRRTMTVIYNRPTGQEELVIHENQTYQSPLLPGFEVPLARLLVAADRMAENEE